ncbi:MAG: serine hydrolase [Flavobacteriales bacterium]
MMRISKCSWSAAIVISTIVLSPFFSSAQLYFPPSQGLWQTKSIEELNWCQDRVDSLYQYLELNETKSFILLKDGKIVLEKYFNGQDTSDVWYWASAGKTLTGFLVGLAQEQGFLDIQSPVSSYIGAGWSACDSAAESHILVVDQLRMTSGLDDAVSDPYCTLPDCLNCIADPGTRWAYHNGPYTLLDSVMEVTTGLSLNQFFAQNIALSCGITGLFVDIDFNHVFFSTARNMAKFGLLLQASGEWNGNTIMNDQDFFQQMTSPSQSLNPSYGYLTWLNGQSELMLPTSQFVFPGPMLPHAPSDVFAAMGRDGQFINVSPSDGLVWIRMGEESDQAPVPFLLNDSIWMRVQQLECPLEVSDISTGGVQPYPNPAAESLFIQTQPGEQIELRDLMGRLMASYTASGHGLEMDVSTFAEGSYYAVVYRSSGTAAHRFIVQHSR